MTTKRWDFRDEDLRRYSVEVEHAVLTGDRRIMVNGREVFHGGKFFDTGGEHAFDLEGHSARLRIGSTGFAYNYTLVVDGLTIPPEGATIPRPARNAPASVVPATQPDRALAEQPVVAALAHGPDQAALARVALVKKVENGGRWFYWIAGLSALNFVFSLLGSDNGFALGTVIDWFLRGVLEELADPSFAWIAHVVVIGLFAFLGLRATAGAQWAFIVGGLLYALDGLMFLLVGGWIGIVVHAFALFAIVSAIISLRQLHKTPATTLRSSTTLQAS
jgi:FAIM1 (Fas apoptotic inhibitory molecule) protein